MPSRSRSPLRRGGGADAPSSRDAPRPGRRAPDRRDEPRRAVATKCAGTTASRSRALRVAARARARLVGRVALAAAAAAGAEDPLAVAARSTGHPENAAASFRGGLVAARIRDGGVPPRPAARSRAARGRRGARPAPRHRRRAARPARDGSRHDVVFNLQHLGLLLAGMADLGAFAAHAMDDRLHEPLPRRPLPPVDAIADLLCGAGALGACWSGAGPSVLAVVADDVVQRRPRGAARFGDRARRCGPRARPDPGGSSGVTALAGGTTRGRRGVRPRRGHLDPELRGDRRPRVRGHRARRDERLPLLVAAVVLVAWRGPSCAGSTVRAGSGSRLRCRGGVHERLLLPGGLPAAARHGGLDRVPWAVHARLVAGAGRRHLLFARSGSSASCCSRAPAAGSPRSGRSSRSGPLSGGRSSRSRPSAWASMTQGIDGLALAMCVAALLVAPFTARAYPR